jgi:hypothetical protein
MSTENRKDRSEFVYVILALLVLLAMTISVPVYAAGAEDPATTTEQRTSKSLHIRKGGRENRDNGISTLDFYKALDTAGMRVKPSTIATPGKQGGSAVQSSSFDFWIYDADVILFADDDRDGYFYGIDLLIDADTIYGVADVYAAVYLSLEGGPWNEYAVTEDFTIFGASGDDEFVLVTELMSGYPTGSYDLLIELFDAWDGSYVASFGPEDTSELAYLPLEDFNRDEPRYDPPVVVSHGGGGAAGLWLLLPLLAFTIRRRFL